MAYVKSSKIAARIGVTPATLKTWRSRGVSDDTIYNVCRGLFYAKSEAAS